jgi:hypothetical protein
MSTPSRELAELLDREKIRGCLARLARGEDRRNTQLIAGSYWPQAIIDHGIFTGTFDEYLAWVVPGSPDIPVTQHVLGQSVIELHSDTALVETHVLAYHRVSAESGDRDTIVGGRYLDWMDKIYFATHHGLRLDAESRRIRRLDNRPHGYAVRHRPLRGTRSR